MLFHHSNDIAKLSQLNCSWDWLYCCFLQPPTYQATHPPVKVYFSHNKNSWRWIWQSNHLKHELGLILQLFRVDYLALLPIYPATNKFSLLSLEQLSCSLFHDTDEFMSMWWILIRLRNICHSIDFFLTIVNKLFSLNFFFSFSWAWLSSASFNFAAIF